MLTITVEGELEARLRARAARAGREPDRFALTALERTLEDAAQWDELQEVVARHKGKGVLPSLLPDDAEEAQSSALGAFSADRGWDEFQAAIAEERQKANIHESE